MELLVSLPSQCYVKQTFCMLGAAGSHFAKRQRPPSRHELGYLNLDQRIRGKAVSRLLCNSLAHYFEFLNQTSLRGDTSASIRFSDISKRKQINTIKMPKLQFYYAPGACSILPHILLHVLMVPGQYVQVISTLHVHVLMPVLPHIHIKRNRYNMPLSFNISQYM